ncbi:SCP2 sterol-binding domain-containing protein [Solwaraspora sp. WMMB335]|uniref:SCP2 sterol-binding domain-containing protein n=1 Tax=Solwaraspora sp. WMMB335 TaxID=3404118 RepID=UPI003B9621C0
MADSIEDALDRFARDEQSMLARLPPHLTGTVRFDVLGEGETTYWYISIGKEKIRVSSTGPEPDATIRSDRMLFDRLASGDERFIPLLFRNALVVEGDLGIADQISRVLFAGAPTGQHPKDFARGRRRA